MIPMKNVTTSITILLAFLRYQTKTSQCESSKPLIYHRSTSKPVGCWTIWYVLCAVKVKPRQMQMFQKPPETLVEIMQSVIGNSTQLVI